MATPGPPETDQHAVKLGDLPADGRAAGDLLRAIARMSPLPIVLGDPWQDDCPAVFCNAAFTRLTGYPENEVLGRNMRFLQGPETDDRALDVMRDAVAAERESQVELWNYRRDHSKFWCSMFVGPVFDGEGRLVCWFGSQLDTGARRELDLERAHAQRMDTLGAMAAGIAHEFNNLMTVVLANAESVGTENLTPRQAERLERVSWAARSAGRLTQQMLAFSGRQVLRAESVNLNTVIGEFDRLLVQAARSDRPVRLSLSPSALPAMVDPGQLQLALLNLVRNASDASEAGSPILIQTRPVSVDRAAWAEIAVIDRGTGMSARTAARAAEPFFTTKGPGSGTGLGLSMVSGFVEQSGGRMVLDSVEGRGTTVRLTFPCLAPDASVSPQAGAAANPRANAW